MCDTSQRTMTGCAHILQNLTHPASDTMQTMTPTTKALLTIVAIVTVIHALGCGGFGGCPSIDDINYSYDYTEEDVREQAAQIPISYTWSNESGAVYTVTFTELTATPLDTTASRQALAAQLLPADPDALPISRLSCVEPPIPGQAVTVSGRFTLTGVNPDSPDVITFTSNRRFSDAYMQIGERWDTSSGSMEHFSYYDAPSGESPAYDIFLAFGSKTYEGATLELQRVNITSPGTTR